MSSNNYKGTELISKGSIKIQHASNAAHETVKWVGLVKTGESVG